MKKTTRKKEMGDVYKVIKQLKDVVIMVLATIIAYIVYVEFFIKLLNK